MDQIFKALNDPARRALLDSLRAQDGQSLSALEQVLDQSRFGVMKHLRVLEDAGLIVTRKQGRFKYHYLNALPLQDMMDRWVAPFLQPQARALNDLKQRLERQSAHGHPGFTVRVFIRCAQYVLWDALCSAQTMPHFFPDCASVKGNIGLGQTLEFHAKNGRLLRRQTVTEYIPHTQIAMTYAPCGTDHAPSHMHYQITPQGSGSQLEIAHYGIPPSQSHIGEGWARLATTLKSDLESDAQTRISI